MTIQRIAFAAASTLLLQPAFGQAGVAQQSGVYRIGGDVKAPTLISKQERQGQNRRRGAFETWWNRSYQSHRQPQKESTSGYRERTRRTRSRSLHRRLEVV